MSKFAAFAVLGALVAVPVGIYAVAVRPWQQRWGVDPAEADRELPGDDLVSDGLGQVTRGITIDAAPSDVWPWLVQMGYGRGGWYSYDQLDMKGKSAVEIVPDWQTLAVGDQVPTHEDGGFVVKVLEPGHALGLYLDTELVDQQGKAAGREAMSTMTGGMGVSGRIMATQPRQFAASWTFVVEPAGEHGTRLIERVRFSFPEQSAMTRVATEAFGLGVFLMMRRQMLGIRDRAERPATETVTATDMPAIGSPVGA